eukprot:8853547-Alexandrium_andersonii.AAC.1
MRWPSRISFGWGQNWFEETGGEAAARQGCEGPLPRRGSSACELRKGAMGRWSMWMPCHTEARLPRNL